MLVNDPPRVHQNRMGDMQGAYSIVQGHLIVLREKLTQIRLERLLNDFSQNDNQIEQFHVIVQIRGRVIRQEYPFFNRESDDFYLLQDPGSCDEAASSILKY